jgi:hypothetical protein
MRWIVVLEFGADGLVNVWLSNGRDRIELLGIGALSGRIATLSDCHIQGPGPNQLGLLMLRQTAQQVMELLDVDELRIEGAARRPAPLVFR